MTKTLREAALEAKQEAEQKKRERAQKARKDEKEKRERFNAQAAQAVSTKLGVEVKPDDLGKANSLEGENAEWDFEVEKEGFHLERKLDGRNNVQWSLWHAAPDKIIEAGERQKGKRTHIRNAADLASILGV